MRVLGPRQATRLRTFAIPVMISGLVLVVASQSRAPSEGAAVETERVHRRDLAIRVLATGNLRAAQSVDVSSSISGLITEIAVKEGDHVVKGQVLAQIDSERAEAELAQSTASLREQEATADRISIELHLAQISSSRAARLADSGLLSQDAQDRANIDLRLAQASALAIARRLDIHKAAVRSAMEQVRKSTVRSPIDGIVVAQRRTSGEMAIGAQSFSPTVLLTVADLSNMEAELLLDETQTLGVSVGQPVELQLAADRTRLLGGRVASVGRSALPRQAGNTAGTSSLRDIKVIVQIELTSVELRPGSSVLATILVAPRLSVLAVPIQAIVSPRTVIAGGRTSRDIEGVFKVTDGRAVFTPVRSGLVTSEYAEILEGTVAGDQIVIGPASRLASLRDGEVIPLASSSKKPN